MSRYDDLARETAYTVVRLSQTICESQSCRERNKTRPHPRAGYGHLDDRCSSCPINACDDLVELLGENSL